jgi:hypothetical protein
MNTADIATRFLGNCQLCEGDFKLNNENRMVHHGYKRPGHGQIEGDCPGVHKDPYEVSCELIKVELKNTEQSIVYMTAELAKYTAGEVMHFTKTVYKMSFGRIVGLMRLDFAIGVTEFYTWQKEYQYRVNEITSEISRAKHRATHYAKRIADWVKKPIRTVEELVAKEQANKAARKAERDAARAARDAKKAATKAKQDALAASRKAIREDFETKIQALAAGSPESLKDRQAAARALLNELEKTKYRNWLSKWDLECEDAFVALGLAKAEGVNGRGRPWLRWA